MTYNIVKFTQEKELDAEIYSDSSLSRIIRHIYIEMPYASGALSELYEELEAEKEEYKILHKKINDIFDNRMKNTIRAILDKYNIRDFFNHEYMGEEIRRILRDYNKQVKKKIEDLEFEAREEKKTNKAFFEDNYKKEIDRKLEKDINNIETEAEAFKNELNSFIASYNKDLSKVEEQIKELKTEKEAIFKDLMKQIEILETQETEQNMRRFASIFTKLKSADTIENLETSIDKNIEEIYITVEETFEYKTDKKITSNKTFNNFQDLEKLLGIISMKNSSIVKKENARKMEQQFYNMARQKLEIKNQEAFYKKMTREHKFMYKIHNTYTAIKDSLSFISNALNKAVGLKKEKIEFLKEENGIFRRSLARIKSGFEKLKELF